MSRQLSLQAALQAYVASMRAVVLAGFAAEEQARLEALCARLSLAVLPAPDAGAFDVCVSKHVRTAAYKEARSRGVPVVAAEWLAACVAQGGVLPTAAHVLPPFTGLHICVTGVDPDERQSIRARTEANGGAYHAELSKAKCTHLVATSAQSDKYQFAQRWGTVSIVSPEWFERSIRANACLDEASFPVADDVARPLALANPPDAHARWTRTGVAAAALLAGEATGVTADALPAAAVVTDPLYLSSCRVFLHGSGGAGSELVDIVWAGGGTCVDDARLATHVVLVAIGHGARLAPESPPLEVTLPPGCKVVSARWLHACRSTGQLCATEPFDASLALSGGVRNAVRSAAGDAVQAVPQAAAAADVVTEANAEPAPLAPALVFRGRFFNFARELPASERDEAASLILQGGGCIEDSEGRADYRVCPQLLFAGQQGTASGSGVAVTTVWLRDCVLHARQLVEPAHRAFKPITSACASLAGFDNVRLCITMCEEPVRSAIGDLCKFAGVKLSNRLIRHKTTHLVCGDGAAASEKYTSAAAWGSVHLVSLAWLYDSLAAGQSLPELGYSVVPQSTPDQAVVAGGDQRAVEADNMLDVVAKLTSAVEHVGKRRRGASPDEPPGCPAAFQDEDAPLYLPDAPLSTAPHQQDRHGVHSMPVMVSASQVEESQLKVEYGEARGISGLQTIGAHRRCQDDRLISKERALERLFRGAPSCDEKS